MNNSISSFAVLIIATIICIAVFFKQLRYIKQYGLIAWGMFILVDFSLTVISPATQMIVFPNLPFESFTILQSNMLIAFQLACILLTYYYLKIIKKDILIGIYIIFFIIWLVEFYFYGIEKPQILRNASICSTIIVLSVVWFYYLNIYKQHQLSYIKVPLFWVALGWLFNAIFDYPLENPSLKANNDTVFSWFFQFAAYGECLAKIFYNIGFWKTKQWILQNQ